jgi:DNA-binding transcriptional ArsR family regulator
MNGFALIADPTRRRILDVLRTQGTDVGGLVEVLRLPQPLVSKHLRVLRDAGAVTATIAGKRRVYRLAADPLPDVLAWMLPYQQLWAASLGQLSRALDDQARDEQARDEQARDRRVHDDQARDRRAHDEEATP